MMNKTWYSSIPRLITIVVSIGLYLLAFIAIVKKKKRPNPIPQSNEGELAFGYNGPERRLHQRAELGIELRYKSLGSEGSVQVFKEGRVRDVSEGGLFLETSEKFEVNNKLEFKVKLPGMSHFILMRGSVVWAKELEQGSWYNYGISISEIDPNDRKQIAKYVASKQNSPNDTVNRVNIK